MLKITHTNKDCDYARELEFLCPKCHLPFCQEDTEQVNGSMLLGHIVNSDRLDLYKSKINEIISWSNSLPAGLKSNITPL